MSVSAHLRRLSSAASLQQFAARTALAARRDCGFAHGRAVGAQLADDLDLAAIGAVLARSRSSRHCHRRCAVCASASPSELPCSLAAGWRQRRGEAAAAWIRPLPALKASAPARRSRHLALAPCCGGSCRGRRLGARRARACAREAPWSPPRPPSQRSDRPRRHRRARACSTVQKPSSTSSRTLAAGRSSGSP